MSYEDNTLPFNDELQIFADANEGENKAEEEKEALTCPVCGGRVLSYNWGYGCSNYQSGCKFSVGTIAKRKMSEEEVSMLCKSGETDVLDGFVSRAGKNFSAKLVVDKEKGEVVFKFPEAEVDQSLICPECGKPMRKYGWGYSCSGYPECRFSVSKKIAGKDLSDEQVKTLIKERKLDKMDGFKSRKGTDFSAGLEIVDGSVKFVFD